MALEDLGETLGSLFDGAGSSKGASTGKTVGKVAGVVIDLFSKDKPAPAAKAAVAPEKKEEPAAAPGTDANAADLVATNKAAEDKKIADKKAADKAADDKVAADKAAAEGKDNNIFQQFFQFLASIFGGGKIDFGSKSSAADGQAAGNQNNRQAANGQTPPIIEHSEGKGWLGNLIDKAVGLFKKDTIAATDTAKQEEFGTKIETAFGTNIAQNQVDFKNRAKEAVQAAFDKGMDASEQNAFKKLNKVITEATAKGGIDSDEEKNINQAILNLKTASAKQTGAGRS